MRSRSDPLVPLFGSAVTLLVIGATLFVFVPAYRQWRARDSGAVVGHPPSPSEAVPVWVCRTEEGVALMLEAAADRDTTDSLAAALQGGPYRFLRLSVFNFDREEPYQLTIPEAGFASPEGGPAARPAAARLRSDATAGARAVLRGLGAVHRLEVPRGSRGQILLLVEGDPTTRTAFVSGNLRFERREVERRVLAAFRDRPDLRGFKDF